MATTLKRRIQLNLSFLWESENININPIGWVLLDTKLNGEDIAERNNYTVKFTEVNTENYMEDSWAIPPFMKTIQKVYEYSTDPFYSFSLNYHPETFKGVYSQYLDKYALGVYNQYNVVILKEDNQGQDQIVSLFPENQNTIKNLLSKQFTYKSYFNQRTKKYSEQEYSFQYSDYKANEVDTLLKIKKLPYIGNPDNNTSQLTDQLLVQLFKLPILKNTDPFEIPLKNQDKYQCLSGLVWHYKIAPIMPYGILDNLAVEGEIDLMQIGIYKQEINSFKYYNTEYQSTLNINMTSYNSVGHTLNTIKLTFYDLYGEVCTYTLPKMISYNGTFQVIVPLDGSLHEGMKANPDHPNKFSATELDLSETTGITFLPNKNVKIPPTNYINDLGNPTGIIQYAYHDQSEPEGLHPYYLYYVTISWDEEEQPGNYITADEGYWYWTNNKFNTYYFDNNILNYNDIDFDLDLSVNAYIQGTAPETETQVINDKTTIYTENTENNPFTVTILPDLVNNYKTLFFNTSNVASFIDSISFGVNENIQEWNRDLAILNIDDTDKDEESYVNWNIYTEDFNTNSEIINYYPSFGNYQDTVQFTGQKIDNSQLTNKSTSDLKLKLKEDLKRVFEYDSISEKQTKSVYLVDKKPWKEKHVCNACFIWNIENPIKTIIWATDSENDMHTLDGTIQTRLKTDLYLDRIGQNKIAEINGGQQSAVYINPRGLNESSTFAGSWFRQGGTPLNMSLLNLESNQLGILTFYSVIGNHMDQYIGNDWFAEFQNPPHSWDAKNNDTGRGNPLCFHQYDRNEDRSDRGTSWAHLDSNPSIINSPKQNLRFYKYGNNYYIFKITAEDVAKYQYLSYNAVIYGINKQKTSLESEVDVITQILQNTGFIQNLQDLIIQINQKAKPDIYIGLLNSKLWIKNIASILNKSRNELDNKCVNFIYNGNAQTVQNLKIKLPYIERFISDQEYYKDPDDNKCYPITNSLVYYKLAGLDTKYFIENSDCDSGGIKLFDIISNYDNWNWETSLNTVAYYVRNELPKDYKHDNAWHLFDSPIFGNSMAGTLSIPYKRMK